QIRPLYFPPDPRKLDAICRKIAAESATRITIVRRDGVVIADSVQSPQRMDNHADRLEVIEALAGHIGTSVRHSHTMGREMLYLAIPLLPENAAATTAPAGNDVLRLSIPITALDEPLRAITGDIIACAILLTVLAGLVAFIVSRRITHPLEKMRISAELFADGKPAKEINLLEERHISLEVADLATALNSMANQLNQRLQTVTGQRNQLEAVFAGMVEAVLVVDLDERIVNLNQAASQLLNVDAAAVQGKPILEILRNNDLLDFVRRSLAAHQPLEDEIVLRKSDGEIYFQAHGAFYRDADNSRVGALIVLNDITRLRLLQNMRRDFVANVSHELRTPITAIKGFVETLQDGAVSCPEDASRFLGIIHRHADRLNAIVEDLLTLSRIEQEETAGDITLEPGSIRPVLQNVIETCGWQTRSKNITLVLDCPEPLTARINGPLLEQALSNLVVNAIKYSPENSEIILSAAAGPDTIRITVSDSGVGIAKEHLPRLFERFYRSDKARSRKLGGTGLGLAIVKHIVQAHHGTIRVDSIPACGTTFSIELPS
ncbi:MAG: ATP-binding protein, partial [Desulfobulbaceae bacterium]|nr:ATP-binding protein [Desulfobulbaceae bacterium]